MRKITKIHNNHNYESLNFHFRIEFSLKFGENGKKIEKLSTTYSRCHVIVSTFNVKRENRSMTESNARKFRFSSFDRYQMWRCIALMCSLEMTIPLVDAFNAERIRFIVINFIKYPKYAKKNDSKHYSQGQTRIL